MFTLYNLLKFLHIAAVTVWVGGVITLTVLNAWLARQKEAAVAALARGSVFFGRAVIAPAAAVTLVAGLAMVAIGPIGFTLWVGWGMAALILSMAVGATLQRRASEAMVRLSQGLVPTMRCWVACVAGWPSRDWPTPRCSSRRCGRWFSSLRFDTVSCVV